jgi:hypothetical protein
MSNIYALKDAINRLHGCQSAYLESVPVIKKLKGKIVWNGMVEVFALRGHANAKRCYAWSYPTEQGGEHVVTVLEVAPVNSPEKAVGVSIGAELRAGSSKRKSSH